MEKRLEQIEVVRSWGLVNFYSVYPKINKLKTDSDICIVVLRISIYKSMFR